MNSSLVLRLRLSKNKIVLAFATFLEEQLHDLQLEVNGFRIRLEKQGELDLNLDQNTLKIDLPLKIFLHKPSGLFTVEGEGEVMLNLSSILSIDQELQVHTNTQLQGHEWIKKPILQLGVLSMPIKTLINLIIDHTKEKVCTRVDLAIRENTNLKVLIDNYFYDRISEIPALKTFGINLFIALHRLDIYQLKTMEAFYDAEIKVDFSLAIQSEIQERNYPQVSFITAPNNTLKSINIPVKLSYRKLESMLIKHLDDLEIGGKKLTIESLKISNNKKLFINGTLSSPAKMDFVIAGKFIYDNQSGKLDFTNIDTQIEPHGLLYKIFKPLVASFIEAKIEDFFPVNLNDLMSNLVTDLPQEINVNRVQTTYTWEELTIESFSLDEENMHCLLNIQNVEIDINQNPYHAGVA